MSTFMAKKENIDRKWYVIDAAGKPLGKTATLAATILRGKHRARVHAPCRLRGIRRHHQRAKSRAYGQKAGSKEVLSPFRLYRRP